VVVWAGREGWHWTLVQAGLSPGCLPAHLAAVIGWARPKPPVLRLCGFPFPPPQVTGGFHCLSTPSLSSVQRARRQSHTHTTRYTPARDLVKGTSEGLDPRIVKPGIFALSARLHPRLQFPLSSLTMSTANAQGHPGLSFGVGGLRRGGYPPPGHLPPSNKPSPSLSQHASPYQPQAYTPQQPSQNQYPHHLFTNPTAPQIPGVASVQNAARAPPPQVPPTLPGPRQRAPPSRQQMQQQPNPPLSYLQQSLNQQPMPQQPMNPQQLSQQSMSQPPMSQQSMSQPPMSQQSMSQQSMSQQSLNQQPLGQPSLSQQQPMSQQLHLQPMSQPPMTQSMSQQQSLSQPAPQNDNSILSQQSTPRPTAQPTLPPAQPQLPQVQQVQKVQQVQQVQQQPTPPQPEPAEPAREDHHEDDIEMASQDESGEGDSSLEPKLVDGTPFVPRQPMGPMMSAPPEGGSFPTLEAVHKHVLGYCTSVGYAIVIGRSKKTVPGLKKVLFVCDRAGKPPKRVSPEMRKRKTTSRKCDCQFGFFAIEQRTQWTVRYRPDPTHLQHNHGPSESPLMHPAARKLDTKMVQAVKTLKESGMCRIWLLPSPRNRH